MFDISKKIFLILFSSVILTGCYTIVWQPTEELPNAQNTVKKEVTFYDVQNFGVFSPYYNSPWWLNPDNDFIRDNFNTLRDINDTVGEVIYVNDVTRDKVLGIISPIILVAPAGRIITNKDKTRNTATLSTKTTYRKKSERSKSIRNNNGGRKNKKGRSR